jgi:RND family efflux transporter MFP subunit
MRYAWAHPGWCPSTARVVALFLAAASPGIGCARGSGSAAGPPAIAVKIETARVVPVDEATEYVATLKSRDSAVIMPQVEGEVTQILVRSGQRVSPGTLLMEIDPAKQQATVKSQEDTRAAKRAALEYAQQHFDRVKGLRAEGISSQADLDQARSALDAAQAELQSLEAQVREEQVQLRYHRVAASTSGIVGDIPVRVGDRVTNSTMLTTVDRPGSLEAYVNVSLERAPRLRVGLPVQILDSSGAELARSQVGFISPRVDDRTQTVLVKAAIPNEEGNLRTAQFVRARIVWATHEGPVVPVLAVSRIGGRAFAFVAVDEKGVLTARQKAIRLGEIVGNDYVVLEGIAPGDRVVVSGTQFLADGVPVKPQG